MPRPLRSSLWSLGPYDFEIDLFAAGNESGYHIQDVPGQKQPESPRPIRLLTAPPASIVKSRLVDVIHERPDPATTLIVSTNKSLSFHPLLTLPLRQNHLGLRLPPAPPTTIDWPPSAHKISFDDQFVMKRYTVRQERRD